MPMRSREKYLMAKVVLWKSWVWDSEKDPGLQRGPSLGISGKRMGMGKTHEVRTHNDGEATPLSIINCIQMFSTMEHAMAPPKTNTKN